MTDDQEYVRVRAVLTLFSTDVGPMPRRRRDAMLIVAGDIFGEAEEHARIQRAIARFGR